MLSSLLVVPRAVPEPASISDSAPAHESVSLPSSTRFPHTRAQLSAIARLYKPADSGDNDADPSLVAKVVGLLDHEHEDELKTLLKASFAGIDDDMVRPHRFSTTFQILIAFLARATRTRLDAQTQR